MKGWIYVLFCLVLCSFTFTAMVSCGDNPSEDSGQTDDDTTEDDDDAVDDDDNDAGNDDDDDNDDDNDDTATGDTYPTGTGPVEVVVGNLDGDGDLDLAVTIGQDHVVSVFFNNGDGTFASAVDYGVRATPASLALDDLDDTNGPDLVVGGSSLMDKNRIENNVSVLFNNGDGTFGEAVPVAVGSAPGDVVLGDLNGDSAPDLVVLESSPVSEAAYVLFNDGSGSFSSPEMISLGHYSWPLSVALEDFNGDTHLDLAISGVKYVSYDVFYGRLMIVLNNGDGTFAAAATYDLEYWSMNVPIAAADFDNDLDIDLVMGDFSAGEIDLYVNDGAGAFSLFETCSGQVAHHIEPFDADNDADIDMVAAGGDLRFYANSGNGTFSEPILLLTGTGYVSVGHGDLDGDGDPDLAVTNAEENTLTILLDS